MLPGLMHSVFPILVGATAFVDVTVQPEQWLVFFNRLAQRAAADRVNRVAGILGAQVFIQLRRIVQQRAKRRDMDVEYAEARRLQAGNHARISLAQRIFAFFTIGVPGCGLLQPELIIW